MKNGPSQRDNTQQHIEDREETAQGLKANVPSAGFLGRLLTEKQRSEQPYTVSISSISSTRKRGKRRHKVLKITFPLQVFKAGGYWQGGKVKSYAGSTSNQKEERNVSF